MRLSILAASSYSRSGRLPELVHADGDVELLRQRLSERDAGFVVHVLAAERGLADEVERLVASAQEPIEALLFFFSGYTVVSEEGFPALVLDGERLSTMSLQRLRRLLSHCGAPCFVILDAVGAFDNGSEELLHLFERVLAGRDANLHLLAAHRLAEGSAGVLESSPFASLLALTLDWHTASEALSPSALFHGMQREEMLFSQIAAVRFFDGASAFELLLPESSRFVSAPPSAVPPPLQALAPAALRAVPPAAAVPEAPRPPSFAPPAAAVPEASRPPSFAPPAAAVPEASRPPSHLPPPAADEGLARRHVAEALEQRGDPSAALTHWVEAIREGRRPGDYRAVLRLFERCNVPDGAWNAACCLEVLGEADMTEALLASAHRPGGLLPVRQGLTSAHWGRRLLCPERDAAVDALLAPLHDAIREVGVETAQRKRRAPNLDPATEQDPERSTATLLKMLSWSSRVLGVPAPRVFLVDHLQVPFFAPPTPEPVVLVSKKLGQGFELPALAFLWSRQLCLLRPEHRPIAFFPSVGELAALVLASLSIGGLPLLPLKKLDGEAKLLARGLRRHADAAALAEVSVAVGRFPVTQATRSVMAWARAVELAAGRAGLLSCGDLALAAELTRKFPIGGLASPDEQLEDLLVFAISHEYAALREQLGVAVRYR